MPVFNNALAGAAGQAGQGGDADYKIERSLRFDDSADSNLSRTFSQGNQKKWTWSAWVKRSKLVNNNYLALFAAPAGPGNDGIFFRNDAISVSYGYAGSGVECYTSSVFRDPSAWYHIVVAVDSDQSTPANRLKIWVNNQLHTLNQYPGSGQTAGINAAYLHHIGLWKNGSSTNYPFDGYLADVHFVDGQQLAPTDFGEFDATTGVWNPIEFTGNHNPITGADYSSMTVASNGGWHADPYGVDSGFNGIVGSGSGGYAQAANGTANPNSITFTPTGGIAYTSNVQVWLINNANTVSVNGGTAQSIAGLQWVTVATGPGTLTSLKFERPSTNGASFGGIRVDGVDLVNTVGSSNGFYLDFSDNSNDAALGNDAAGSNNWTVNNLASGATVANKGFDCFTYTGTNATQAFTNLAFQPDFLWFKSTSRQDSYGLYDVVRGRASNLYSDLNHSVNTSATSADLVSFNSNGFTLGQVQQTALNRNNEDYVVWAWKAGGTPSTLNTGSISASVSANTAYGFSIVKYTGDGTTNASVAHGLGSTPKMVIVKNLATGDWKVRHTSLASTHMATLNENYLANTASWNGETNSVFYPARSGDTYLNTNTNEYIAYCWSEISGFSKFGSWSGTGNGGSSGPVITLGFKPRWVLFKRTDQSGDNWTIFDTARDSGTLNFGLQPNIALDEQNFGNREILVSDTGFQVRSTGSSSNQAGGTYIYAAFAEGDSSVIDSLIDSPTNYEASSGNNGGNYCVLNPLASTGTLSNGNLTGATSSTTNYGTFAIPSSGSWYWECTIGGQNHNLGIAKYVPNAAQVYLINDSCLYSAAGVKNVDGVTDVAFGGSSSPGDVIGVLANADTDTVTFYRNGTSIGSISHGVAGRFPVFGDGNVNEPASPVNFGQRPFAISSMPTGAKTLCTQNLDDPLISKGSDHFIAKKYNGSSGDKVVTTGFQPDLVWIKNRTQARWHRLADSVRGVERNLYTNSQSGEDNSNNYNHKSFTSTGFTVWDTDRDTNSSDGDGYISWSWNGGSTFSNNAGSNGASIASSGTANTVAGFSIVSYTGTGNAGTVKHGLNTTPEMIWFKGRNFTDDWRVYHKQLDGTEPEDYYLIMQGTNARSSDQNASFMNDTAPTSSVFSLGTDSAINGSSKQMIAYCFAPTDGYCAVGKYTGNASSNGAFVYTGFKPAFVMVKADYSYDGGGSIVNGYNWYIWDNERSEYNLTDDILAANKAFTEESNAGVDFLSNGFKLRNVNAPNAGQDQYYIAFAEHPFKYARAR